MIKYILNTTEVVQTRRRFLRHCVFGAGTLALAGCTTPGVSAMSGRELAAFVAAVSHQNKKTQDKKPPLPSATIHPKLVKPDVALEVKIGQMLMLGFRGTTAKEDPAIVRALTEQHIGGVVLFDVDVGG